MSDEPDKQAAGPSTDETQASAENTAADSQPEQQPAEPAPEGTPAEAAKEDKPSDATFSEKQKTEEPVTDSKPKSRRSAQYRIEQLARENAQLRKDKGLPPKAEEPDDNGEPQPETAQPDISKQVQEEVDRRLAPVLTEHSKAADDTELAELFAGERASERAKYEQPIRDMWKLPQYKDVAASDLYKIATYDQAIASAQAKAVEDYKKAQKEAKHASGSGSSDRKNTDKVDDAWSLSDEEFKKRTDAARMSG